MTAVARAVGRPAARGDRGGSLSGGAAHAGTSRPPRVMHVVPALFDADDGIVGGAERYAFELARHMAEAVPTTLIAFGARAREERVGRLRVRVLGRTHHVRGQRTNPIAPGLVGEIRAADVVHCHQQHVVASSVSAAVCRLTGRRVVVSELGGGGWDVSAYVSTDRWYHAHLHISEYSRRVSGHAGRPWARVILGGVDADKFAPAPAAVRDGPVLFVGRLLPHKGVDDLVRAVADDVPLEVIGRPMDPAYLEHLRALAAGKQVVFRHDCDDAAIVRAYQRAACVVLPSVYHSAHSPATAVPELLGQTLLEGMACGAPAVCTDVASMPEVVADGVTGYVVPPNAPRALGDRLRELRADPGTAAEMGRAGRARVLARFTWPAVVRRCLDAYAGHGGAKDE